MFNYLMNAMLKLSFLLIQWNLLYNVLAQHWKHLCECNPKKHRLLYRHTLADLYDLLLTVTERDIAQDNVDQSEKQVSCFTKTCTLTKKVFLSFLSSLAFLFCNLFLHVLFVLLF